MTDASRTPCALELTGISKSFVGVRALTDASLTCHAGEVHALVGENGAGKSTLLKIASGALRPDAGSVRIGGKPLTHASPRAARALGLLTAYQDTSLVPELTVAENVLLSFHGVRPLGVRLRPADAARLLEPYELPFAADDVVADLGPGGRQLLEVVRAMIHRPSVLLLDEPTAALDAAHIARLERLIADALADGAAILYISHRLDEVQRLAHRLTVIRDGRIQGTYERDAWEVDEIVALMVGTRTDLAFPPKPGVPDDAPEALAVEGLRGDGFGPVDLRVRAGEVVGIAGAEGNGQRELVRALVGLRRGAGRISLGGRDVAIDTPRDALAYGISFQSGDRVAEGIFRDLSVMDNATLAVRDELGPLRMVMRSRQRERFAPAADELGIVCASPDQPIGELSGGNQQKAILARAVMRRAELLVVDEPTQGVDARARLDIYRALREQAAAGSGVLVCSSDASELAGLCDRVYVVSRGKVVAELRDDGQFDESRIVSAFVNASGEATAAAPPAGKPSAKDAGEPSGGSAGSLADGPAGDAAGGPAGQPVDPAPAAVHRASGLRTRLTRSTWTPLLVLAALILVVAAYTATQSSVFLSSSNIAGLLILTLPLAVVALGQQALLISGGFDISIGSTMSIAVVVASFVVTSDTLLGALPGILLCLAVGVAIGAGNGAIVRGLRVSPIVATIATLGILQGAAILLRPEPDGVIGLGLIDPLTKQIGFLPLAFVAVVVIAVLAELWLRTTTHGLTVRATGLAEEASRRTGIRVERVKVGAYVLCSVVAVAAGLLLATQVGLGQNGVGAGFALPAFTACFLGGAALTGGRGSFVGALLGALFLSMLINVAPLLSLDDAWSRTATGVLTILAVLAYSVGRRGRA